MKDLLENNHFKEVLAEKVKREVSQDLYNEKFKNLKPDKNTKTSELRRKSAFLKIDKPFFSPRQA